jgi:hypothetical protein
LDARNRGRSESTIDEVERIINECKSVEKSATESGQPENAVGLIITWLEAMPRAAARCDPSVELRILQTIAPDLESDVFLHHFQLVLSKVSSLGTAEGIHVVGIHELMPIIARYVFRTILTANSDCFPTEH